MLEERIDLVLSSLKQMLSLLSANQSHIYILQKFLVLYLFGLDLYVDIGSMYRLLIEIEHSLQFVAYG